MEKIAFGILYAVCVCLFACLLACLFVCLLLFSLREGKNIMHDFFSMFILFRLRGFFVSVTLYMFLYFINLSKAIVQTAAAQILSYGKAICNVANDGIRGGKRRFYEFRISKRKYFVNGLSMIGLTKVTNTFKSCKGKNLSNTIIYRGISRGHTACTILLDRARIGQDRNTVGIQQFH